MTSHVHSIRSSPMTVIDYRNPAPIRNEVARASLLSIRHPDGSTELRMMYPPARHYERAGAFTCVAMTLFVSCVVALASRNTGNGIALLCLLCVCIYVRARRVTAKKSMHRWVASPAGLLVERVSPAGFSCRRYAPRNRIGDVVIKKESGKTLQDRLIVRGRMWTLFPLLVLERMNPADVETISTALREGLGLPPLIDPTK